MYGKRKIKPGGKGSFKHPADTKSNDWKNVPFSSCPDVKVLKNGYELTNCIGFADEVAFTT